MYLTDRKDNTLPQLSDHEELDLLFETVSLHFLLHGPVFEGLFS